MWDPKNCDRCGDCFVECLYVDWDRDKAVREISKLIDTGESEILTACVTCCGCNEYCEKGANPWDLILKRQDETGCLPVLPKAPAMFETAAAPSSVVRGEPGRPAISLCMMEPLSANIFQGRVFEGLTVIKGGSISATSATFTSAGKRPYGKGRSGLWTTWRPPGRRRSSAFTRTAMPC